jgi:hypothetical protein
VSGDSQLIMGNYTARLQDGWSCVNIACDHNQFKIVVYLCECGGKDLLMLLDKVSV